MKVFYSHQCGDYVVDAMCECGHLKREHGSMSTRVGQGKKGRILRRPNEGSCCKGKCPCPRFTWDRWVTATEFMALHMPDNVEELVEMTC